jgi:PBSX family phage terminase large subunit
LFGGKDEGSQELVQGITAAGALFDEVALMPESFVNQATARCSFDGSKLWFNCNPEGPLHWFKTGWIDKAPGKNLLYLHFTMDDNLSLSEKVKARYRSMYTGVFWKRFVDGEWAIAEGIIYEMFDREKHVIDVIEPDDIDSSAPKYISVDYGTQNPTVFHLWEMLGKDRRWACTKEYHHSGRDSGAQKTDSEYADDYEAFVPKGKDGKPVDIAWTIVDPSAASFIAELKRRGVTVKQANNDVLNGIRLMRTMLALGRIVYAASCKHAIGEFGMYAWDEKAAARGEDAPVKESDHCMDADRYFVNTVMRRERKWDV